MEAAFLKVLNMSLTGSYVILAILVMRLLLRRAPRKYSYALWSAAGFRLVCPLSFSGVFSLFSLELFSAPAVGSGAATTITYIPSDIGLEAVPKVDVGLAAISDAVNSTLPAAAPEGSVNPIQVWIFAGTAVWCIGIAVLAAWALVSYLRIKVRLRKATLQDVGVYACEGVRSPFILGVFSPKIYLPYGLDPGMMDCVLAHERCHIRKKDPIVKLLGYGILVLHWFNPLCWLAYYLMCRDMEMRCDEFVLENRNVARADYSMSLLSIASDLRFPSPSPLAFSETGVKTRIQNILKWKPSKPWVRVLAAVLCVLCLIGCGVNPTVETGGASDDLEITVGKSYVTEKLLFMSGLSSSARSDDNNCRYWIDDEVFVQYDRSTGKTIKTVSFTRDWEAFPFEDEAWKQMFDWGVTYASVDVDFLSDREDTRFRYVDAHNFLLRLEDTLYLCSHYQHTNGEAYVWDLYALTREDGGNAFQVDEPVVEFARDCLRELSAQLSDNGVTVSGGEILRMAQVPTGTAGELLNITLYAFDYRLSVETPESEIIDEGLTQTVTAFRPADISRDYPQRLKYEEGCLVPAQQTYLLLAESTEDHTWQPMWVVTEDEIRSRFGTAAMDEKYGDMYTAAAMELYGEYMEIYG